MSAAIPGTSTTLNAMTAALSAVKPVQMVPVENHFCRRVTRGEATRALEQEYTRHMNGRGESYFTKKIRRFSVPLSSWLVRLGARPVHVTLGGAVLAAASAWFIAQGYYAAGLLGGVLYYMSMIFDCSDGGSGAPDAPRQPIRGMARDGRGLPHLFPGVDRTGGGR